jgi:hypothetical protein
MPYAKKEDKQKYLRQYYLDNKQSIQERKRQYYLAQREWQKIKKELPVGLVL